MPAVSRAKVEAKVETFAARAADKLGLNLLSLAALLALLLIIARGAGSG